jgi:hypothetical protein
MQALPLVDDVVGVAADRLPCRNAPTACSGMRASAIRPTTSNQTSRTVGRIARCADDVVARRRLFDAPTFTAGTTGSDFAGRGRHAGRATELLGRIRFALHLAAGRAEERLLFDYQRNWRASSASATSTGAISASSSSCRISTVPRSRSNA